MKIAIFASAFHPSFGGVEELTRQLAHAHLRAGHQVIVVTERWPRDLPADERFEGIPIRRFPMRVPATSWKSKFTFALTHGYIRSQVAEVVREFGADVLHVQCVSSTTLYALHVRRRTGIPLVVTLQGELTMDAAGIFQKPGIAQKIMHKALREADFITACSAHALHEAEDFHARNLRDRARVIPNGIRLEDFSKAKPYAHGKPYILAMGRHVRQKGFDVLLRAFADAGELGHDLLLAGDGDERQGLRQLTSELNLGGRVHWPGQADRTLAVQLFKGCSFFVLPSRADEGLPVVCAEAMASGKAIIASRVGGVPEIVLDGETGVLVPAEDVRALAAALQRLAGDGELCERMGASGAERVKAYDWVTLAEDYRSIYNKTIAAVKPTATAAA